MLTIFAIPKAFVGHNAVIQRNALKSWLQIIPRCEIILLGDDEGVEEAAREFGLKWIGQVEKTDLGTPLLSSVFRCAQKNAKHNLLLYANADILFFPDILDSVKKIQMTKFIISGRRWDMNIADEIDFKNQRWVSNIRNELAKNGKLHSSSGMDYYIFPKDLITMPPFAVGRQGWDSWLLYAMRQKRIPIIDASNSIVVIHQNHDYSHSRFGTTNRVIGPELDYNIGIAGGYSNMLTLREADWLLMPDGIRRPRLLGRFLRMLSTSSVWQSGLALKRTLFEAIKLLKYFN